MVKSKEEIKKYQEEYRKGHKTERKIYDQKRYYENNEYFVKKNADYYLENKEERKFYFKKNRENNKEYYKKYARERIKFRRNNDLSFNLRSQISKRVVEALRKNGSSKNGSSILNFLPYLINELKQHLESQFEPWMSWDNWDRYSFKNWDDNDSSTWTWQIDHIVPQSTLPYTSMEDDNFKKCWALDNLRPYSAKQNLLDGLFKIRHKDGS